MKPSFLKSTLSIAFILCILTVIACIFLQIPIDDRLLAVLTGIVGTYAGSRSPNITNE